MKNLGTFYANERPRFKTAVLEQFISRNDYKDNHDAQ